MGEFEFHIDGDVEATTEDAVDFPEFVESLIGDPYGAGPEYDLIGADPDEDGLWDQLMLDMDSDVNPYVVN